MNLQLIIDYNNSTEEIHSDLEGLTVFDALNQTANVTFTQYPFGKFIESINGLNNNEGGNGFHWQYWVNDELGHIAADLYPMLDGDRILWKYCEPAETLPSSPPPTQLGPEVLIGPVLLFVIAGLIIGVAYFLNRRLR